MKFLPQVLPITSFGDGGFRFESYSHLGSLLVLPSGMRAWDGEDFSDLLAEKASFDFAILGTGAEMVRPLLKVREFLATENIAMEYMSTSSAVHNYNVLLAEGRRIAGAFIAVGAHSP